MNYAVLYNVFLCWMVALVSLAATRALLQRPRATLGLQALALCWNFAALLWFMAGLRLLAYFAFLLTKEATFMALDRAMFYAGELFLGGQIVSIILFAVDSTWRNRYANVVFTLIGVVSAMAFLIMLFVGGLDDYLETSWGSEHVLPQNAFYAFLPAYLLSLFTVICVIIKGFWERWRRGAVPGDVALPAALGLLLYGVAGIFDVRGSWGGWQLLLIRVSYLIAALVTFWVARPEDGSIRVVRSLEEP
ncbi:MAG: hypothetical protein P9L99_06725 [Candidatus Lernaella stagnicola]|nr:hypothetical protein [Candidatus Lernaella stagnicola]